MQQPQRWRCHLTELNRDKSLCCRRTHTFDYLLLLSPCWLVAAAVAARADKETQLVKRYTSIYPVSVLLRVAFCQFACDLSCEQGNWTVLYSAVFSRAAQFRAGFFFCSLLLIYITCNWALSVISCQFACDFLCEQSNWSVLHKSVLSRVAKVPAVHFSSSCRKSLSYGVNNNVLKSRLMNWK